VRIRFCDRNPSLKFPRNSPGRRYNLKKWRKPSSLSQPVWKQALCFTLISRIGALGDRATSSGSRDTGPHFTDKTDDKTANSHFMSNRYFRGGREIVIAPFRFEF
jgi:hypothetical protein